MLSVHRFHIQQYFKLWNIALLEQDKSSDIEQQLPFGDRKYSNLLPQKGRYITNVYVIQFRQSMKRVILTWLHVWNLWINNYAESSVCKSKF